MATDDVSSPAGHIDMLLRRDVVRDLMANNPWQAEFLKGASMTGIVGLIDDQRRACADRGARF